MFVKEVLRFYPIANGLFWFFNFIFSV
jgi:hypothetical protein